MTQSSANLTLPFIQPAQAQKHVTHNEAIELLDIIVQLCLQACDADTPPAAPTEGQSWHIGAAPNGEWTGNAGMIASWAGGGWLYFAPQQGWRAYDASSGVMRVYSSGNWSNTTFDAIRLSPQSTPAAAVAGDVYFESATNKARCFDGAIWQDLF